MPRLQSRTETAAAPHDQQEPSQPKQWWQWFLLYPTLLIAVVSAVPTYLELFYSKKYGVPYGQSEVAKQQDDLWGRNLRCSAAPFDGLVTESNVQVDATICRSGDVLVRVQAPNDRNVYKWVSVDALLTEETAGLFPSAAFASPRVELLLLAQNSTICQRFLGPGKLLRRIRGRDGDCFDEIINTYTGEVISRSPASCDSQC